MRRDLSDARWQRLLGSGSAVVFVRRQDRRFAMAGELAAHPSRARDDACVASCIDWYGNSRPIFLGDRMFALMCYELVEGRVASGRIREVARVGFAPPAVRPAL